MKREKSVKSQFLHSFPVKECWINRFGVLYKCCTNGILFGLNVLRANDSRLSNICMESGAGALISKTHSIQNRIG